MWKACAYNQGLQNYDGIKWTILDFRKHDLIASEDVNASDLNTKFNFAFFYGRVRVVKSNRFH